MATELNKAVQIGLDGELFELDGGDHVAAAEYLNPRQNRLSKSTAVGWLRIRSPL
jgi:hypothetical protein